MPHATPFSLPSEDWDLEMGIELAQVSKTFETKTMQVRALEDLTFDIDDGEFVSIIGPSGCGKSTLLRLMSGLIPATSGWIRVDDSLVTGPLGSVGFVFQSPTLFKWRTIFQNVMFPYEVLAARRETDLARDEYEKRAHHLLEMAGIADFADAHPKTLSGGMQQRASICRALVHDPTLLLMDEPFGALDEFTRERMNLELQRIWDETRKTVAFVTHHIPEAVFLSDRVIVMSARPGRLIGDLRIDFPRPRSPELRESVAFLEKVVEIRRLIGFEEVEEVDV